MAWRLNKSVQRGEIDSRERGTVRGRIWLHGRADPIELVLQGDPMRDLAGCFLTFINPAPERGEPVNLAQRQEGAVGDMTASRKVKVPDDSWEEVLKARCENRKEPFHYENCLYLEWYSERNGRVVIESVDYDIRVSPPAWQMSVEEEVAQAEENQKQAGAWMYRLTSSLQEAADDTDLLDTWEPMSEFDWERSMKESDALTDRYSELLEKYRDDPDRERLIAREMGWHWLEEHLDEDPASPGNDAIAIPVEDLEPNAATEGRNWIRVDDEHVTHPLTYRAHQLAVMLGALPGGRPPEDIKTDEDYFRALCAGIELLAAKLAGALDDLAYGPVESGYVVASLKRALKVFDATYTALGRVRTGRMMAAERIEHVQQELFAIREEMLNLMQYFRDVKYD